MLEAFFTAAVAIGLGLYAGSRERRARNEGVKEAGVLMQKLCNQCPEGSYAREAYEFVIEDWKKLASVEEV